MTEASDEEIELYTHGSCHVLAVALHRKLGLPMIVVTDQSEIAWQDDADPDNCIFSVVHVFSVLGDSVIDILGSSPREDVLETVKDRFGTFLPDDEFVASEAELRMYVRQEETGDDVDWDNEIDPHRPLNPYTDEDVDAAWEVAMRLFPELGDADTPNP